jgi:pimeloyl-ACP methyl ester carboxylesterase
MISALIDQSDLQNGGIFATLKGQKSAVLREHTDDVPPTTFHFIDLPQTTLHYVKCGEGPPLVMVPATVSEIENWLPLAQLMGRYFTTYFFELPGHGKSTPFSKPFSSQLVAETIEAFIDRLGHDQVTLLGFSFGGVLTMSTLFHLQERIERVVLFAPAITHRALSFPKPIKIALRMWLRSLCNRRVCYSFIKMVQHRSFRSLFTRAVQRMGGVEDNALLDKRLVEIEPQTYHVLARQMFEVIQQEYPVPAEPFRQPCHFAMSINDPLLDFDTTLKAVQAQFAQVHVKRLTMPYHQAPEPLTYRGLLEDYGQFIEEAVREVRGPSQSRHIFDPGASAERCLLAPIASRARIPRGAPINSQ